MRVVWMIMLMVLALGTVSACGVRGELTRPGAPEATGNKQ